MPNFRPPTDVQVSAALLRITRPQLRRAFFDDLKNPLWVEPLANAGIFLDPPEPEITSDGLIRDVYWPEIDYLVRVAPEVPGPVVDVLLKLGDSSTNAWVRRAVFTIGASIPADGAAKLKPLIKSWNGSPGGFGWRTDPRDLIAFVVNLLQGGQHKAGKWMANLLFRPTESDTPRTPRIALEDYWYAHGLPRVVSALGDDGLKTVFPWLEAYERLSGHLADDLDVTYLARASIRYKGDHHPSVEQALIDAVRDLAVEAMATDPDAARAVLLREPMILARKIALFAAREALAGSDQDASPADRLLGVAAELLAANESRDESCRIEYGELAREMSKHSSSALEPFIDFIAAGPKMEMDALRARMRRDDEDTPEEIELRVQLVVDRWKHSWLSAVGAEALPPVLKPLLEELDTRLGAIESPLTPVNRMTTWSGPNSPVSRDEMAVMSPAELAAHLEGWHDTSDGWGPEPSHEGQGRELTALISTNPEALDSIDDLVARLRPTYLRALLQGWEAALKAGLELKWQQVADLVSGVLAHADSSSIPVEGGDWDDDVDFRWTKNAAVSLLDKLAMKRETPTIPQEMTSAFADLLINSANDETAWAEYDEHESQMDPLNLAINRQWPIRVHGLINLMAHGTAAPWYEAARSALEREIARPDRHGASRAVVGEGLGRLLSVDPDWLKPRIPALFGSSAGISSEQQIALTTAVAVHYYHPALYDLLAPALIAAIQSTEPLVAGWRSSQSSPLQRIGEWAVNAIMFGHKTLNDPVAEAFFARVDPKIRGQAIGHIAWSFMNAETVDKAVLDGLADLWDARVKHVRLHPEDKQELNEFYWFVRSGKFDVSWWLPRLKEAAELDPELARERFMIGKQIAASADFDPRGAFDATKMLLANREDSGMPDWDLTHNAVPMVLARAIDSGDDQLKEEAVQFMNELGSSGNRALEKQVDAVLSGGVTQDDVSD